MSNGFGQFLFLLLPPCADFIQANDFFLSIDATGVGADTTAGAITASVTATGGDSSNAYLRQATT